MSNEIQKEDFILPGNIGTVNGGEITQMEKRKDGSVTLTINPPSQKFYYGIVAKLYLDQFPAEDADFEVIQPKQKVK